MARIRNGVVVGKDFRPPDGANPADWCYLIVDLSHDELISVRLHRDKLDTAIVGDRITFSHPRRHKKKVRFIRRRGT